MEGNKNDKILLVNIDSSQCRINDQADESAIGRGESDLVTYFPNQDFKCKSSNGILTISPKNGSSFTLTVPSGLGPVPNGFFDHIKFLAYSAANTLPLNCAVLQTTWLANAKQLNIENDPYGDAVVNPNTDFRLASVSLSTIDSAHLLVFDFKITNKIVYAIIERVPGLEDIFGTYAAFAWAYPVLKSDNLQKEYHKYSIIANRDEGSMTWFVDNKPVLKYTAFGFYPSTHNVFKYCNCGNERHIKDPNRFLVNDYGGVEPSNPIEIIRLQSGIGLFTDLDYYLPNNTKGIPNIGLVRLESARYRFGSNNTILFNNNPLCGGEANFVYNSVLAPNGLEYLPTISPDKRIWGQGALLNLKSLKVTVQSS